MIDPKQISLKKKIRIIGVFLVIFTLIQMIYRTFNLNLDYFNLEDSILDIYTIITLLIVSVYYVLPSQKNSIFLVASSSILLVTLLIYLTIFSDMFEWSFMMMMTWIAAVYFLLWGIRDLRKKNRVDETDKTRKNNTLDKSYILVVAVIVALIVSHLTFLFIFARH